MLNNQQQAVVDHPGGPLMVLACPGSGKTRCITSRITTLLDEDISPSNILAVTFTNKAAKEMAERIKSMGYGHSLSISTFHSFCVKVLRKYGSKLGYKKNFSICDSNAQKTLISRIVKSKGHNPKDYKFKPQYLLSILESKKNQYLSDDEFYSYQKGEYVEIFLEYQKALKLSNSMDFGDLIYNVILLFETNPRIRDTYAKKFEHLLVDEMQDTNKSQMILIRHLASHHNNIIAVGDIHQCFPGDVMVETPKGPKRIDSINMGDTVNTLIKPGQIGTSKVTRIYNKFYTESLLRITLEDGTVLRCTPNHLIPMDVKIDDPYFIYIMYKKNLGFRIGMCKSTRQGGFAGRLGQECADAIWVIDTCKNKSDASIKEQFYSVKYGIPTVVFHIVGRKVITSDDQIKWLFDNLNTYENGRKLLKEKGLDLEIPHHMPRMHASKRGLITMNVSLCSDRGMHKYSMCTNNKTLLEQFGKPRKSKFKNWRIESSTRSIDLIDQLVKKAKNVFGDKLNIWMSIKGDNKKPLRCQPASNLKVGSFVYQVNNDTVNRSKVVSISKESYHNEVYDLDVEKTHNYIANKIVVHNSIYGWRHACIENILKFKEYFKGAKIHYLNINYRCAPKILTLAENLINENPGKTKVELEAYRNNSSQPEYADFESPEEEAEGIADIIKNHKWNGYDYKNIAILCRTNALTRVFEECFRRRSIPYSLIGTFGFYDRKEVRDAIAFMKFLANPNDIISFEQIINTPSRGVGPATLIKILEYAQSESISFVQACQQTSQIKGVSSKASNNLTWFLNVLDKYDPRDPYHSLLEVFEETSFLDYYRGTDMTKNEHREDNILEFLRGFYEYCKRSHKASVDQYLQEIMLLTSADKESDDDSVRIMTCHAAKGLEFEVVIVPGMEEDMFPHKRSIAENTIPEERRVCYVAVTRAKDQLHLTRSLFRTTDGATLRTVPSRFLADMQLISKKDWEKEIGK